MNHREPPHPTAGVRRAKLCLALLLPTVFAPTGALAARRTLPDPDAYLPAIAAPTLRFQTPSLPRDLVAKLTFPKPAPKPEPEPIAPKIAPAVAPVAKAAADPKDADDSAATKPVVAASAKPPTQIIPDDTRTALHPEDFVPFFQLPGSARNPGGVNVIVPLPAPAAAPAPGTLPQSSATYRQTP